MAKIVKFTKGTGNVSKRISEVECVYNVGLVNGEKIVTLSTYGSNSRKNNEIASQVLHVDKNSAKEIISILKEQFSL